MTRSPGVTPVGRALGPVAAATGLTVALVHLLLLRDGGSVAGLVLVAMAVACLPCAWHLWRGPTRTVWTVTAGVDAAMGAVHLRMMTARHAMSMPAASPHGQASGALMWAALALVVLQLALAAVATVRRPVHSTKHSVHRGRQASHTREPLTPQR